MSETDTALLVIDVQESFRIYSDADVPAFVERLQTLIDGAKARKFRSSRFSMSPIPDPSRSARAL